MRFKLTSRAADFVIDHGGNVYVSIVPYGRSSMLHAATQASSDDHDYVLMDRVDGYSVYASQTLADLPDGMDSILVRLALFPRRHLAAVFPKIGGSEG